MLLSCPVDLKFWDSPHCTVRGINNFKSRASCHLIQERPRLQDYAHRQRTIAFPMWLESDLEQFLDLIFRGLRKKQPPSRMPPTTPYSPQHNIEMTPQAAKEHLEKNCCFFRSTKNTLCKPILLQGGAGVGMLQLLSTCGGCFFRRPRNRQHEANSLLDHLR